MLPLPSPSPSAPHAGLAAALARLAAQRDPAAWTVLTGRCASDMRRLAERLTGDAHLAEDAVQEALLQIRDGAGRFAPRSAEADLDAWRWIMRVAANTACNLLRNRERVRARAVRAAGNGSLAMTPSPDPAHALERAEQTATIRRELAALPEAVRTPVVLHCVEGLGFPQVAAELRCPVGTAKTRVRRGLGLLRENLTRVGCTLSLGALATVLAQLPASETVVAAGTYAALLKAPAAASFDALPAVGTPLITKGAIAAGLGLLLASGLAVGAAAHRPPVATTPSVAAATPTVTTAAVAVVPPVTLASLLAEMLDRDRLARLPSPAYTCLKVSSHEAGARSPDLPGWFSNNDTGNYLRSELHDGRTEFVMLDAAGPGAIVRWWRGGIGVGGNLRVYCDGSPTPVIVGDADALIGGRTAIGPPLAAVRSLGLDWYLPIPYAQHCTVTFDRPGSHWYGIEYRSYAPGTVVRSLGASDLQREAEAIAATGRELERDDRAAASTLAARDGVLAPGSALTLELPPGPAAVRELTVRLDAPDRAQALRSTLLTMTCDGEPTVCCPVGDFFGSGIGLNPFRDRFRSVEADGTLRCRWTMPVARSCTVALRNLGSQAVVAQLGPLAVGPWTWDQRSLHFHCAWHQQYPLSVKANEATADWNYVTIRGQGVYVGDTLAVYNGADAWWGSGDEQIWLDDQAYPAHFGTGTEDYYGYSLGSGQPFHAPFHAAPRCEGNVRRGYATSTRVRSLDAIPFSTGLRFELEIRHTAVTDMAYAAATCWYARPGATCNRDDATTAIEAARPVPP